MIEIRNVSKSYKVPEIGKKRFFFQQYKVIKALDDINLEIEQGQTVGLLGLNGAGKTTLIKIMAGLIKSDENGIVKVNNFDPCNKDKKYLQNIALVSGQKNQLLWDLSAMDTFYLNKAIYNITDSRFNDVVQKLAKELNVENKLNVPIRKLSLGQKMKLEIIAAMIHTPKILYLDEPTIGLDIVTQINLRKFIKKYSLETNATTILTSHNIADISFLCDRIIFLDQGKVIFDINVNELNNKLPILNNQIIEVKYGEISEGNIEYLKGVCKIKKCDNHELVLQVHKDRVININKYILENIDVNSISINDTDLDDVIKNIYGSIGGKKSVI